MGSTAQAGPVALIACCDASLGPHNQLQFVGQPPPPVTCGCHSLTQNGLTRLFAYQVLGAPVLDVVGSDGGVGHHLLAHLDFDVFHCLLLGF
jgi:hypothetical protein